MKDKKVKGGKLSLALVMIVVMSLTISTVVYARVRISLEKTTMATMMTQRLYTSGGGGTIRSSNKSVIKLTKDSKSIILTARQAGVSRVTATIGGVKKSFKVTVLNNKQIAARVLKRVRMSYARANYTEMARRGNCLYIWVYKPQGDGAPTMKVKVNLQTGRAVCGDGWAEFFSRVPKSFVVF